jgi:hypothetical protein
MHNWSSTRLEVQKEHKNDMSQIDTNFQERDNHIRKINSHDIAFFHDKTKTKTNSSTIRSRTCGWVNIPITFQTNWS